MILGRPCLSLGMSMNELKDHWLTLSGEETVFLVVRGVGILGLVIG